MLLAIVHRPHLYVLNMNKGYRDSEYLVPSSKDLPIRSWATCK
jgi:hypothetical protein